MTENKFGKTSRLFLRTCRDQGKTRLEDVSFTAPYKIMTPFSRKNGGISVMPLCASAGIMEGDRQEFEFQIGQDSDMELLSQSFDKIHRMKEGCAKRRIRAQVEKGGTFYYYPQPVIPYQDSSFESDMGIHLADDSAHLFLLEIISCGRSASQERFAYRKFSSKVLIYRGEKLIYRDNTRYEPAAVEMEELGMYEGYTHMANLFLSKTEEDLYEQLWEILEEEQKQGRCDGGVTRLAGGDLSVRMFGNRGQTLMEIAEKMKERYAASIVK